MSSPHIPRIVLSLATAPSVRTWSSTCHLRIGRLPELEVVLDDPSVSRLHAEVLLNEEGWVVRDRGSSNGTARNGVRIGRTPQPVSPGDTIQVGTVVLKVDDIQLRPSTVRPGTQTVRVEASAQRSWADGADPEEPSASGSWSDQKGLLRLVRMAHQLAQATQIGDALRQIVNEAAVLFDARRGAIFLSDEVTGQLTVRSFVVRTSGAKVRPPGKTLAAVAFRDRRSLLFKDRPAAARHLAESALRGEMHSVVCAVLRGPDRELGVLHLDRGPDAAPFTEADLHRADALAAAIALGLDRQQLVERHEALFLQTVTALSQAVEMRDESLGNHAQRVTTYALLLAEELGLDEDVRRQLRVATLLHDIGKIAIDDQILRKAGRLADHEADQLKTHVIRGAEIIQMIPGLAWALPVIRGHHERWDGRGYPDGLAGEDIPLAARVVAVADSFDSLTADRPHHKGTPAARAFAELQAGAGTHFDPECVAAFLRVRAKVEALLEKETAEERALESGCDTVSNRDLDRARSKARRTKPSAPVEEVPARSEPDPNWPLAD